MLCVSTVDYTFSLISIYTYAPDARVGRFVIRLYILGTGMRTRARDLSGSIPV